jgi:RNA polymerase sigma-70 factor (ECF subfamily)
MSHIAPGTSDARARVRALYLAHGDALLSVLERLTWPGCDVEDLLQEVFMVALRRREALFGTESPKAWLYGVAVKVAATTRRNRRLRSFFGLKMQTHSETSTPQAQVEIVDTVQRALAALSAKKREVLVLYELEGLTGPEIALALNCPLKTVWTRLHHARRDFEAEVLAHG